MNKFLRFFFALVAMVFFGTSCGITVHVGGGFTSHSVVEHYYYDEPRQMNVLLVPGQPNVSTLRVQRSGGDPSLPREEKITLTEYGPTNYVELLRDSSFNNRKAERAAGNTGGRDPTHGYRH